MNGPQVHVFEPALCCSTGLCGEDVPQDLVTFTADVEHVTTEGGSVTRHNLAADPQAFAADATVRAFLERAGSEGLPLTTVDGVTVLTGAYPSRAELCRFAGLVVDRPIALTVMRATPSVTGGCGCDDPDCC